MYPHPQVLAAPALAPQIPVSIHPALVPALWDPDAPGLYPPRLRSDNPRALGQGQLPGVSSPLSVGNGEHLCHGRVAGEKWLVATARCETSQLGGVLIPAGALALGAVRQPGWYNRRFERDGVQLYGDTQSKGGSPPPAHQDSRPVWNRSGYLRRDY